LESEPAASVWRAPQAAHSAGLVLVAEVTGAHGVGGNVRLRLIANNSQVAIKALESAPAITARSEDGAKERSLTLKSIRQLMHVKGCWTAHFKEVTDRNEAETLYRCGLYVQETDRPELESGEYYVDDLIGMKVVTDNGHDLGTLSEVLNTPANDVYVTSRSVMFPAVSAFLIGVDVAARTITVRDVPGLRDDLTPEA
jgi:16S rRNA processing protein RimM